MGPGKFILLHQNFVVSGHRRTRRGIGGAVPPPPRKIVRDHIHRTEASANFRGVHTAHIWAIVDNPHGEAVEHTPMHQGFKDTRAEIFFF